MNADSGSRTHTLSPASDFESDASAYSAISAVEYNVGADDVFI